MQGWVYKPASKRAIEAASRQGSGQAAEASPEIAPAGTHSSVAFLPVRFAEAHVSRHFAIEVVLGGGRRIAVGPGFDEETLRRVVIALESGPC
jgi:hypothetical protein